MRACVLSLLTTALFTTQAVADGLPLSNGRYVQGRVSVFTLTAEQRAFIECVRTTHTDNSKTPYVFRLTASQATQLRHEAGLSPARFEVYETYRGNNDAGPHWNLALRFSESQIEVPHKLLLNEAKANEAEFKVQGWKPNPSIERTCAGKPAPAAPVER
jgi:hypothetical protein